MIAQGIDIQKALDCAERVFSAHLPGYILGRGLTNSPLRTDRIPSFSVYWKNNKWLFRDWGNSEYRGDVIDFIKILYGCGFSEAVQKIIDNYENNVPSRKMDSHCLSKNTVKKDNKPVELDIKSRPYFPKELLWWKQFGISESSLIKYKIHACEYIFINKHPVKCKLSTYAFEEKKDGKITFKFYCPEALNPKDKWLNNNTEDVWQGWEQLPLTGDILIWTKSRKDIISIVENTEYSAVGLQAESVIPKLKVVDELKNRFKQIYILYDNDFDKKKNWGRIAAQKLSTKFNIPYIEIPEEYQSKDFSDLVKNHSEKIAYSVLFKLIS